MPPRVVMLIAGAVSSLFLLTSVVIAGETIDSLLRAGMPFVCAPFGAAVSASEGKFSTVNQYGCVGAFQFCPATLANYYDKSAGEFLAHPGDQVTAWLHYQRDQWKIAVNNHLNSLLGRIVCHGMLGNIKRCSVIHDSAIIMACQFGCGKLGKLANYLKGQDCEAREVKDGNLVSVCDYILRGAGYDVSCFTGGSC